MKKLFTFILIIIALVGGGFAIYTFGVPNIKEIYATGIDFEIRGAANVNVAYVSITIETNKETTIYDNEFSMYCNGVPTSPYSLLEGRGKILYCKGELTIKGKKTFLVYFENITEKQIDKPLRVLYKGKDISPKQ